MPNTLEKPAELESDITAEIAPNDGGGDVLMDRHENSMVASDNRALKLDDRERELAKTRERSRAYRLYLLLPILFLTVALMGGLRLAAPDGAFIFFAPALISFILAGVLIFLFARGGLIAIDGWFSDDFPATQNIANGVVLLTTYAATVQVFNSVLPESGLPFWVVSFCFAWSLWNNLFVQFETRKLLKSMMALFAFAFAAKYIVLAGLTAPANDGGWLRSLIENPARETFTWLLELPRYSAGTGYIQFFCIVLYFAGLYILPKSPVLDNRQ